MTAWLIKPICASRDVMGGSNFFDYVAEAAAQTCKAGAPILVTAGVAAETAASPAQVDGFAAMPGHNLAAADTLANWRILKSAEGRRFEGNLLEALATNLRYALVGLVKDGTTGIWIISTAAAVKQCKIVRWNSLANIGDTLARVEFELIDSAVA